MMLWQENVHKAGSWVRRALEVIKNQFSQAPFSGGVIKNRGESRMVVQGCTQPATIRREDG